MRRQISCKAVVPLVRFAPEPTNPPSSPAEGSSCTRAATKSWAAEPALLAAVALGARFGKCIAGYKQSPPHCRQLGAVEAAANGAAR